MKRPVSASCRPWGISIDAIDEFLDYLCSVCEHRRIFYLWRPELPDADDDFLLELAIETNAEFIISFNKKDFPDTEKFGIRVWTPREFLQLTGDWP